MESESAGEVEEILTNEEQIELLKQKLSEGAIGPYEFDKEYAKYHTFSASSPGGQLAMGRSLRYGRNSLGQTGSTLGLSRQNTTRSIDGSSDQ